MISCNSVPRRSRSRPRPALFSATGSDMWDQHEPARQKKNT